MRRSFAAAMQLVSAVSALVALVMYWIRGSADLLFFAAIFMMMAAYFDLAIEISRLREELEKLGLELEDED